MSNVIIKHSRVRRLDSVVLTKPEITAEGFLKAPARVSKVGVLKYLMPDGSTLREFVSAEELFSEASMKTLGAIPVTNGHPAQGMVTSGNAKDLMRGFTGETIFKDGDIFLGCEVKITDVDLIEDVKAGKRELSCGYNADIEMTPGVFNGEPYDAIQRNREYNHIAVVFAGRAGEEVRLRVDEKNHIITQEPQVMAKIKVDGKEIEVSQEVADAFGKSEKAKVDSAEAETKAKKDSESLQGQLDAAKASQNHNTDEAKKKSDADAIKSAARERAKIVGIAKSVLKDEALAKVDETEDLDLMKAVILADNKDAKFDGKSEDYIKGQFEFIASKPKVDSLDESAGSEMGEAVTKGRADGDKDYEKKELERQDALRNRWKKPIGAARA